MREQETLFVVSPPRYIHDRLSAMQHYNGAPVAELYCKNHFKDPSTQGAIVNFNLLRSNGNYVGYSEVCECVGALDSS